jgi:hypothetical protein
MARMEITKETGRSVRQHVSTVILRVLPNHVYLEVNIFVAISILSNINIILFCSAQ